MCLGPGETTPGIARLASWGLSEGHPSQRQLIGEVRDVLDRTKEHERSMKGGLTGAPTARCELLVRTRKGWDCRQNKVLRTFVQVWEVSEATGGRSGGKSSERRLSQWTMTEASA